MQSTILHYHNNELRERKLWCTPVPLDEVVNTLALYSHIEDWDWKNLHGLVVMHCDVTHEAFVIFPNK